MSKRYRNQMIAVLGAGALLNISPVQAETAAIKAIQAVEFVLADEQLQQFGFALPNAQIQQQVVSHLAEWQFPVKSNGPYSHQLQARLGKVSHQVTPVGFSFTSGNSDPRSTDFQKADVLPITCTLRDSSNQALILERESTFSAHQLQADQGQSQITRKVTDQISTACLDVLESAPQPKSDGRVKTSLFKPKWMPDLRIEVKETPAPATASGESSAVAEEPRKQVIIHNQGTPVIIQFGHERR